MLKTTSFQPNEMSNILNIVDKSQLPYHEYRFLSEAQLKDYFANRLTKSLENSNTYAFTVVSEKKVLGLIKCEKNDFDSENFGFACYRITDLLLFDDIEDYKIVINMLISTLEEKLSSVNNQFHLTFGLNNNIKNVDKIFNCLTANNYYYIHTLVTLNLDKKKDFEEISFYPKENLTIRLANKNDVEQVSKLAEKSFRFSRFHLDPFIDDEKAGKLLKESAKNSILHGFVDALYVGEINNKIVSYVSVKKEYVPEFDKTKGSAVIVAVDMEYRGLGIFKKMNAQALCWLSKNTDFYEFGTYLANNAVHRTLMNEGLRMVRGIHQFTKLIG